MSRAEYGEDFFVTLRERYTYGLEQDSIDRREAEQDVLFASGGLNQWDPKTVRARKRRPVLTENRLGPSIAQVVNDGRQNKPSITTTPMEGGTEYSAEHFQGRIRQIEYECDADIAYDTAREQQVTSGRGWLRVSTRYRKGSSGEQEICIDPIENQFSVVWDPTARRYDLADAEWMFVVAPPMSIEAYERRFGKNTLASRRGFFLEGDNPAPGWMGCGSDGKHIQVADYYTREVDDEGEGLVKIFATNGVENLDETEWIDGERIPVVPQWGIQRVVDGVKRTYSLIRNAKDPQKLVNLYVSNIAEQIAQMPKSPFLAAEGQIAGRENEWETINEVQRAVVQYKTRSAAGDPVGPPQRIVNEPPIQALVTGYLQAVDAIKAAMGIYDAALGQRSNETSGLAIEGRKKESDVANFHFADNEERTRKAVGRILLAIIPKVDGTDPAEKPVRDKTGQKVRMAKINQLHADPKTGQPVFLDMANPGNHAIAVASGPSYTSQRQEENDRLGQIIQSAPEMLWIVGDLYFATSDGPGAEQMAERMQRAIALRTPGLIEADGQDPKQQIQQLTTQAQQLNAQNQQLVAQMHALAQQIETKQLEQETKFRVAALDNWTKLKVAEITAKVETGIADADREGERLEGMFDRAHEAASAAQEHAHTVLQAQQQQEGAQAMAEQQAAQQSALADQQAGHQAALAEQQQANQQQAQNQNAPETQ